MCTALPSNLLRTYGSAVVSKNSIKRLSAVYRYRQRSFLYSRGEWLAIHENKCLDSLAGPYYRPNPCHIGYQFSTQLTSVVRRHSQIPQDLCSMRLKGWQLWAVQPMVSLPCHDTYPERLDICLRLSFPVPRVVEWLLDPRAVLVVGLDPRLR